MARLIPRGGDRDDLSVPRGSAPSGGRFDSDAFGRMSESLARFLGTGRYLVAQTVFVVGWIALNLLAGVDHWDPYPFILLNLAFSTQAAYAAPLILLAQNRQAERDKVSVAEDRAREEMSIATMEYLTREIASLRLAVGELATRDYVRGELQALLKDLDDRERNLTEDEANRATAG